MHEVYLLGRINCNEIEIPDHVWEYQFHIRCPFCNYIHRVDSDAAAFLYEWCELPLPITDAPWIQEDQQTLSVRVSHTQYPLCMLCSHRPPLYLLLLFNNWHAYIYLNFMKMAAWAQVAINFIVPKFHPFGLNNNDFYLFAETSRMLFVDCV